MLLQVYALFDASKPEQIQYIGKTQSLRGRYAQHVNGHDARTRQWVLALRDAGGVVGVRLLGAVDESDAARIESEWIQKVRPPLNVRLDNPEFDYMTRPIKTLREVELEYIYWVLAECGGNKREAAKALGIGRQTLYNKLSFGT